MTAARTVFYYDLGSPYAYLAAERVASVFEAAGAAAARVAADPARRAVPALRPRFLGQRARAGARTGRIERRASAYGLPPIRWPEPFPGNTLFAMRVATFAKEIGRAVSFSLAAFRQAFAAGRDLTDPDNVFLAAAVVRAAPARACEAAAARDAIKGRLREATERAGDLGVMGVPSVVVGEQVFWGDDRLEEAAAIAAA